MKSNYVPWKLHPERDADIITAIADSPDRSARLRDLVRKGIEAERSTESVTRNTTSVTRKTQVATPKPGIEVKQFTGKLPTRQEANAHGPEHVAASKPRDPKRGLLRDPKTPVSQQQSSGPKIKVKESEAIPRDAVIMVDNEAGLSPAEIIRRRKAAAAQKLGQRGVRVHVRDDDRDPDDAA